MADRHIKQPDPLTTVRGLSFSLRVADLALAATIGALHDIAADLRATTHHDDDDTAAASSSPPKFPGYL
jgi:hypothetical protein